MPYTIGRCVGLVHRLRRFVEKTLRLACQVLCAPVGRPDLLQRNSFRNDWRRHGGASVDTVAPVVEWRVSCRSRPFCKRTDTSAWTATRLFANTSTGSLSLLTRIRSDDGH